MAMQFRRLNPIEVRVDLLMGTPVHVASIRVDGATHTRRSFLNGLVQSQLVTQSNPTTLESAIHTMGRISQLLHKTDIFHSVSSHLEKSQGPLSVDGDVDIIFTTREKGRLYLNTSTEVGNGEGSAVSLCPSQSDIVWP
jgi:outer membrane protein insertion porin family